MVTRRELILTTGAALAGEVLIRAGHARAEDVPPSGGRDPHAAHHHPPEAIAEGPKAIAPAADTAQDLRLRGESYRPCVVPNGAKLPFRVVGGTKVFHLQAEEVRHEMVEGLTLDCWGYNGRTPGPLIELVEGDRARIYVTNRLPEPTSVHWHGVILPNGMDGVAGLTQKPIRPGETFKYEFTFKHPGTYMYHPHFDEMTQMAMGMMGMIVVHPKRAPSPAIDRDFVIMLSEWQVVAGSRRPNPLAMNDFNMLTMNSVAFPKTEPLLVLRGERVRIRFGNLGAMDHHPIHFHGHTFRLVATDGGPVPSSAQLPETTVLVPVGSTRDIEFIADNPGDWPLHCHMTHHAMNQMGHEGPSMIGADPKAFANVGSMVPAYMTMGTNGMGAHGQHAAHMRVPENSVPMKGGRGPFGHIDMGGMFTVVKIRDRLPAQGDAGWYDHPPDEVATVASAEDLARDGIDLGPR